ncbi:MAG: hypothetical protein OK449_01680 [Thaumarchaeota archaeon]|nr:hypothetical protein [Nitrososphaerota archaeon]
MPNPRTLTTIIIILIAALLISTTFAGYYLLQYQQAQTNSNLYLKELKQSAPLTADILLDFGNGTSTWYNDTVVQPGWNVYLATVEITHGNMNTTWYPQYGEHLINGIDGVQGNSSDSWFLWSYNTTSSWQLAQSGADQIPAPSGSVFGWSYCETSPTYAPACDQP